eukprot:scaffold17998_cov30-Tisochrysis_lutea.AAC.7
MPPRSEAPKDPLARLLVRPEVVRGKSLLKVLCIVLKAARSAYDEHLWVHGARWNWPRLRRKARDGTDFSPGRCAISEGGLHRCGC